MLIVALAWLVARLDAAPTPTPATGTTPAQIASAQLDSANGPATAIKHTKSSISPAPSPALVPNGSAIPEANIEQVTERYPNGNIKIVRQVTKDAAGNYVNQGTYTQYDADGKVQRTGTFINGKQNGMWTQSFAKDEGHLLLTDRESEFRAPFTSQATFNDGQLHGTWTIKDHNGNNIVEWNFDRGIRNGKWTWWYPNGQKRLQATYVNGNLDGDQLEWSRDGKVIEKNTYVDGRRLTSAVGWYTLGQKHFQGYYLCIVKMPEATYDWWNGTVATDSNTPSGKDLQHGQWIEWYRSGAKKTEANYDHGVATGKVIWWYENGQKQAEVDYEAGVPNGVWITWHPNGLKESQAEYQNGQIIGDWLHWNADGKLVEVRGPNDKTPIQSAGMNNAANRTTTRMQYPASRSR
jgi:antitoxin component YwqK of YwqJK toxin-antitoxin module